MSELPVGHVAVVSDDLAHMLGRHVLFLGIHEAKFPLLGIPLGLQLLPFTSWPSGKTKGNYAYFAEQ